MNADLVNLPWETLMTLACGYASYFIANTGNRSHHQPIDVAFSTLTYGFLSMFVYFSATSLAELGVGAASLIAFIVAIFIGAVWRKWGRNLLRLSMKKLRISFSNDDPTVLSKVFADTKHNVSQLIVVMNDGSELMCNDVGRFADAAIAPFVYGQDGSVAMYVTHSYSPVVDGEPEETVHTRTRDSNWGDNMTIIPESSIRNVKIRFKKKR